MINSIWILCIGFIIYNDSLTIYLTLDFLSFLFPASIKINHVSRLKMSADLNSLALTFKSIQYSFYKMEFLFFITLYFMDHVASSFGDAFGGCCFIVVISLVFQGWVVELIVWHPGLFPAVSCQFHAHFIFHYYLSLLNMYTYKFYNFVFSVQFDYHECEFFVA